MHKVGTRICVNPCLLGDRLLYIPSEFLLQKKRDSWIIILDISLPGYRVWKKTDGKEQRSSCNAAQRCFWVIVFHQRSVV